MIISQLFVVNLRKNVQLQHFIAMLNCQDASGLFPFIALREHHHEGSDASQGREKHCRGNAVAAKHAQGHQLCRDRGTDVGAIDDRGRLGERHDAHVHETDDHHRHRARALDGRRAQRSNAHAEPLAIPHLGKQPFQARAACTFKTGTQHFAGHQKHPDACD